VPLSPAEIGQRVQAQFGQDIVSAEDQHGHAVLTVTPARYVEVARFLRDDPDLGFDYFDFLTGVDFTPKGRGFELIVHLHSTTNHQDARIKLELPSEDAHAPSIHEVWPGANWFERETWEMFGISFDGHPHLVKLELPEQFEGHPLRKDFVLMTREAKPWPGLAEGEEAEEE
jgi:NADH-quinone oxidoreductase subunit C